MGRPTKYNDETVRAICADIEDGVPASIACVANGVAERTHYDWQRDHPQYAQAIARARAIAVKNATKNARGFDKDGNPIPKDHQWWLERQAKDEFGTKLEVKMVRDDAIRELLTTLRARLDPSTFAEVVAALDSGCSEGVSSGDAD